MTLSNEDCERLVAMPAKPPTTGEAIRRTKLNRKIRASLIQSVKAKGK